MSTMSNNPWVNFLFYDLDPIAIVALGFAAIVFILSIIMLTVVARRSSNKAWEAVRYKPKLSRAPSLLLPLTTLPPRIPTQRAISIQQSTGSLNVLESIAEEPTPPPCSSAASTVGLLNDWATLEIDYDMPDPMPKRKAKTRSRSMETLSLFFSAKSEKASLPLPAKECWWKSPDFSQEEHGSRPG